jgi:hypothetical protein
MRQFQRVREREYAADKRTPKNKRGKGQMCATPRDSAILPYLMTPAEIEQMYKTQEMRDDEDDEAAAAAGEAGEAGAESAEGGRVVGLCRLNPVDSHGLNPAESS